MIFSDYTARCTIVQSQVLRLHHGMSSIGLHVSLSVTLVDQDHIGRKCWKLIPRTILLAQQYTFALTRPKAIQLHPGERRGGVCCRRPNTSKFRYLLINTSKLIPANIFTYILIVRDDLSILSNDSYVAAVIGPLTAQCRYDNQSAS